MTERIGPFVQGEKPPPLVYQFLDSAGAPLDLTGWTQARFSVREQWAPPGALLTASVTNPAQGQVTYTWTGTEFPTAGHYLAELWVGNSTNRLASVRLVFDVAAPVGSVPNI